MAILTISREYGSGGREIGRLTAERLGYRYVDKERLFQDLEQAGQRWGRVAKELDEVAPTPGNATTGNIAVLWLSWRP